LEYSKIPPKKSTSTQHQLIINQFFVIPQQKSSTGRAQQQPLFQFRLLEGHPQLIEVSMWN